MYKGFIRGWAAVGFLVGLAFALPSQGAAQRSGVEIWSVNCGRCHNIQPANKYDAVGWERVGMHMTITARLTTAEAEAVVEFLQAGARTAGAQGAAASPASSPIAFSSHQQPTTRAEETFAKQCAPCHGSEGKGDGVAAAALNPKPRDFTSEEFAESTMEQIVTSITGGKGVMPAFGALLTTDQIAEIADYVMKLAGRGRTATAGLLQAR